MRLLHSRLVKKGLVKIERGILFYIPYVIIPIALSVGIKLQGEYITISAIWFGLFFYINRSLINKIDSLQESVEEFILSESDAIIGLYTQLKNIQPENEVNGNPITDEIKDVPQKTMRIQRSRIISAILGRFRPYREIRDAKSNFSTFIKYGYVLIIIGGLLTIWPNNPQYQIGDYQTLKQLLYILGIYLAFFMLVISYQLYSALSKIEEPWEIKD